MLGFAELEAMEEQYVPWKEIPHKEFEIPEEWKDLKARTDALKQQLVESSRKLVEINSKIMECYDQTATLRTMQEKLVNSPVYYEKFGELLTEFESNCGLVALIEEFGEVAGEIDALKSILEPKRAAAACPICMENDVAVFLDPCGHTFCEACVNRTNRKHCPCCRVHFEARPLFFN